MQGRILVVDDQAENRMILEAILEDTYIIDTAESGLEAAEILKAGPEKPMLILSDVQMPGMDGYGLISFVRNSAAFSKIPVILITASEAEDKGLAAGAIDFITKPFEAEIVRMRVANQIELAQYRAELERKVEEKTRQIIATKEHFLESLANMIEYRSMETGDHINRMKGLTAIVVEQLLGVPGYAEELKSLDAEAIVKAAALHDIGKIGIPDNILLKPGKLTEEEFEIMKTHAAIGGDMIAKAMKDRHDSYTRHCYCIACHHHEKWNGSGYPHGLSGTDIPLSARIVAIADVYDALTNERCYKEAMPHEQAMAIITEGRGSHFDPTVADALVAAQERVLGLEAGAA